VVTASAEIFDPVTGHWSATGSLSLPRRAVEATTLSDGTVLVAGGFDHTNSLSATAERFDPTTGTWSAAGSLSSARAPVMAQLHDGRVLAIASIGRVITAAVDAYSAQ
jgi:hypothetical protein